MKIGGNKGDGSFKKNFQTVSANSNFPAKFAHRLDRYRDQIGDMQEMEVQTCWQC